MENKETAEVKTAAQEQGQIFASKEEYAAAIKEQVELILKQREEESKSTLDKRIEQEIEKRLADKQQSERERIEEARRMIAEAEANEAMEKQLLANERYNRITDWKKNKIKEFEEAVDLLAQMGFSNKHEEGFYKRYTHYSMQARQKDSRAQNALGCYNLTYAAMKLGGKGLRELLFRNIGVDPRIE